MSSRNRGHKRARNAGELRRRGAHRQPYAKVLIVCEGEKTEPFYFNGLKDAYGLNSANVEVFGECGSDPVSVFDYAVHRYRLEKRAGDPFDRVYCVFDKDAHANYETAVRRIAHASPKGTFFAATSVPCFEYWLLLHFRYTTRPYQPLPGNSAGNQVLSDLCEEMPGYQKAQKDVFRELQERMEDAKQNANRALTAAEQNGTDNPSTRVHELVDFLQNVKNVK